VLWSESGVSLSIQGAPALTSAFPDMTQQTHEEIFRVATTTIDEYVERNRVEPVGLIMLDTEGSEEQALLGAQRLLSLPAASAPDIIFEVYSNEWSGGPGGLPLVRRLIEAGFHLFAIRDLHGNLSLADRPLEVVPIDTVYVPGVPHGFNLFATKKADVVARYGLTVVDHVSPKLLSDKDTTLPHPPDEPTMHLPSDGLGLGLF
jgi:hypothetical protein